MWINICLAIGTTIAILILLLIINKIIDWIDRANDVHIKSESDDDEN